MKSKEQLEYELTDKYLELRDGRAWRKEHVSKNGRVIKARPAKGWVNSYGYLRIKVGGKMLTESRIMFMLAHKRPIREGYEIDHINLNRTDNSIGNLRELTSRENKQNKQIYLDGKLVGGTKSGDRYKARIYLNGKLYHLGYYKTPEQAHAQYRKAERFIGLNPELLPHLTPAMLRNFINEQNNRKDFLENDDN